MSHSTAMITSVAQTAPTTSANVAPPAAVTASTPNGTPTSPRVVWSQGAASSAARSRSASAAGRQRSTSTAGRSRSRAATKRNPGPSKANSGPPNKKKKRVMYDYKMNLWDRRDGEKKPITLDNWRIMNVLLCEAAARKLRKDGPPKGGIGQKHWQEHSDGTRKTSELPETERIGHTVIRFSTMEAQNWYQPVVDSVLGTAQDGSSIKFATEVETKDGRARYVISLPAADFTAFGNTKEEREATLMASMFGALEESVDYGDNDDEDICRIYSSFLFQDKSREDMWKMGVKFPTLLETKMDAILRGEKFGILPSAITSIRVLKKQNSTMEEDRINRISQALKKTALGVEVDPNRDSDRSKSRESKRGRSNSDGNGENTKKVAAQSTPDAMK